MGDIITTGKRDGLNSNVVRLASGTTRPRDDAGVDGISNLAGACSRIAVELLTLSETLSRPEVKRPVDVARAVLRLRRRREAVFGNVFDDPLWDMLLDLFVSHYDRRPVTVSGACLAASVPPTTALRYVRHLVDSGLAYRVPHPQDRRVVRLVLEDSTVEKMTTLLSGEEAGTLRDGLLPR